jgi:DNA-binding CsgD family transcriptional regulator
VLTDLVGDLGLPGFERHLLARLRALTPAASCSVYRTGSQPALFLSGALDVPDTTRQCWQAYLSGPWRNDRSLHPALESAPGASAAVCHITAGEVPAEHRARIYEAHGVAERVSVVQRDTGDGVFAVNFYRHATQPAFTDAQLASFGDVAGAVLALTRKHLALAQATTPPATHRAQLQRLCPNLTARELDVCERLLRGLTQEGVAADLGLSLPTVKTYRNRAFSRLGIHFRSELSALLLPTEA